MTKDIYIFIFFLLFHIPLSYGRNSSTKNTEFSLIIGSSYISLNNDCNNTSPIFTDSLRQSIKKIFQAANNAYKDDNLQIALELYNKFIYLSESQNCENNSWPEIRLSLSHISSIYSRLFNYDKANYYLKKALAITLKYNNNELSNIYFYLSNIGLNYYSQEDYHNSLGYYHQAEALLTSTNSLPLINKAQLYNNLALCYFKLGMDYEFHDYINKSIKLKKFLGNYDDLATNYNNLGLVFQRKEQYKEALGYFNKSLFLYDSLKKPNKSAFVLNNIGNLYIEKGFYDSSNYFYQKALSIRKNAKIINYHDLIISYNNLSIIYCELNNLDSARLFNNQAVDLNIQNLETKTQQESFSISDYLVSITDRVEINLKKYKITKDDKHLIESFDLFYPTVKLLIDQLIKYNSIFSANIFTNDYKRFFDSSILSARLLDSINTNKWPRTIIISETFKSLSLLNLPSEIRNLQQDTILLTQFENLNKYYQWQQCLFSKDSKATEISRVLIIDSLINSTLEIDHINNNCLSIFRNNLVNYFNNVSDSILAHCINLKDRLIVDYYICDNTLFIHAISKSNISCFVSSTNKQFTDALTSYPKSIKSLDQKSIKSQSKTLSSFLLFPITEMIKLFDNITIIPDQKLIEIPFETLHDPNAISLHKDYLVENNYISYRFSILNRNYSNKNPLEKYSEEFLGIAPFEQNDSSMHNLSGSTREIIDITNLFLTKTLKASNLIGKKATYNNLTNSNFDSKILHFSTHSFVNRQNSSLSFLELFPVSNQFYLFLPVLSCIPFRNELLMLSACETGSNLINSSTGFVSIIRSMSNISIRNYICTLWKIFDVPSYDFIMNFYDKVLIGYSYSQALTLAKRNFIQSDAYNNLLFWSPFILYENN